MTDVLKPHRGALILTFGILGVVVCFFFGIAAWVMANADQQEMDSGRMDPQGRDLTQVGKVLGMVSVGLTVFGLCIGLGFLGIGILGSAAN